MHDEAILAGLDGDPDRFAIFFRRHAGELLDWLLSRTHDPRVAADLCAETFAEALHDAQRFDPSRSDAEAWLRAIAARQLARAERRGEPDDRALRRLGMARLAPGDRFVAELEEELVAAARFRAQRRLERVSLPRVPVRRALAAAAALALVAGLAALASNLGDGEVAHEQRATSPSSSVVALPPMLPPVSGRGLDVRGESAFEAAADLALLTHRERLRPALAR